MQVGNLYPSFIETLDIKFGKLVIENYHRVPNNKRECVPVMDSLFQHSSRAMPVNVVGMDNTSRDPAIDIRHYEKRTDIMNNNRVVDMTINSHDRVGKDEETLELEKKPDDSKDFYVDSNLVMKKPLTANTNYIYS